MKPKVAGLVVVKLEAIIEDAKTTVTDKILMAMLD